jgi:hypothetical protein
MDDMNNYTKSIKITAHNINVDELKSKSYNDALIQDILNPEIENTEYYLPCK